MAKDELFEGAGFSKEELDSLLGDVHTGESSSSVDDILKEFGQPAGDNSYSDRGEYRSYDGNREYRSFDVSMDDGSSDGWYPYSEDDRTSERTSELPEDEESEYYDDFEDDDDDEDSRRGRRKRKKGHPILRGIGNTIFALITLLCVIYLFCVYSDIPQIKRLRETYIMTAMSTYSHKYLATALVPPEIIDDVMRQYYASAAKAVGIESDWGKVDVKPLPTRDEFMAAEVDTSGSQKNTTDAAGNPIPAASGDRGMSADEAYFFSTFWELDEASVRAYMDEHPEALINGWYFVDIDASGLGDGGTSIQTIYGDQVLAVNAIDGVTLVRIYLSGNNSRGVLAICKDTSRLSLCPASTLGSIGQVAGTICDNNGGILAMTGSAFKDPNGEGDGGEISGLAVCSGTVMGERLGGSSKRIELRNDNYMYIRDSYQELSEGTRDACEFQPALIVDGKVLVEDQDWNGINPRAAMGQSERLETMMIVVEGRLADSLGCSTKYVADKLAQYGCVQALNLDGGTSAMMYYRGKYVNRCSNTALPGGRTLPTAWVYKPYY